MSLLRAWTSRHTAIGLVALLPDVHGGPSCLGCSVGSSPTSSPSRRSSDSQSFTTCVHNHPTMLSFRQRPLYSKRVIQPNVLEKPSPLLKEPSCNWQNQQAIINQPPRHKNRTSSLHIVTFTLKTSNDRTWDNKPSSFRRSWGLHTTTTL